MTLTRAPEAFRIAEPARIDPRWPIELLWASEREPSAGGVRGGILPAGLQSRYAGRLDIPIRADRPTILANFVATVDGVVALDRVGGSGGREISGGFEPDRFMMGLLRATADAVLVGAGTVRASRTHGWTPAHAHPASAAAFTGWRRQLGLDAAPPPTVIVSASGALERHHIPDPESEVIIVTTEVGARTLGRLPQAGHVEIVPIRGQDPIPPEMVLALLESRGFRVVLSEGGPAVFGQLLQAQVVDEIFLTVAPQLAGRGSPDARLSLVEGVALAPGASWAHLKGVMRAQDHLFLRYQMSPPARKDLS
jgi:riboflavin biosynthesis pyrimidine reductase